MHDESPPRPGPQPELSAALDAAAATAGLVVSWAADLDLADVLAAMRLRERRRAGLDIPGWDEPDWSDPAAPAGGDPSGQAPVAGDPVAGDGRAGDPPGGDVLADGFLADGF